MTTLNIHAQESKSRFSCLSAADPENIPDVRKKWNKSTEHYENTKIKQTAAARPKEVSMVFDDTSFEESESSSSESEESSEDET